MKKQIYLFSIALVLTVFMSASAKAASTTNTANNSNSESLIGDILNFLGLGGSSSSSSANCSTGTTTSTKLPINNGVVFLTIAGMAIGIVTIKKRKVAPIAIRS